MMLMPMVWGGVKGRRRDDKCGGATACGAGSAQCGAAGRDRIARRARRRGVIAAAIVVKSHLLQKAHEKRTKTRA